MASNKGASKDIEAQWVKPVQPSVYTLSSAEFNQYDDDLLRRSVEDAGRWAFGIVFSEVWVLNEEQTHLIRPRNGWWIDPSFSSCDNDNQLLRLTDSSRHDYFEPEPLAPGCGLPGVLWAEAQTGDMVTAGASSRALTHNGKSERSVAGRPSRVKESEQFRLAAAQKQIPWREVIPLAEDPDQPYNPRLIHLAKCGLGWAAGVPFSMGGSEGLVIYMARATIDSSRLCNPTNEAYLTHATLLIGAAYSMRGPRQIAVQARKDELQAAKRRVKAKLHVVMKLGKHALEQLVQEESHRLHGSETFQTMASARPDTPLAEDSNLCTNVADGFAKRIRWSYRKFFGANVKAPPLFTWEQALWSSFCAFLTLMVLTNIGKSLVEEYGRDAAIVLGPFGALMTLQYGLTAAPASQPRNAILGQLFSLVIAQSIGQIESLEIWFKMSLATSLAIGVMVKLGVTHPPAGAGALLFSTGNMTWNQVWIMLMANVVAIFCATILNNLSAKRQYPTFWGFRPINDFFKSDEDEKKRV